MSAFPPNAATDTKLPHDSLVPKIIGICSGMLVFTTIVVAARFLIRWRLTKGRLGADDYCMLAAWVLAVAYDLDPLNRKSMHHNPSSYSPQFCWKYEREVLDALADLVLLETKFGLGRHIYDLPQSTDLSALFEVSRRFNLLASKTGR